MIISREFLEGKKGAYSQRKIPPMMQNERDLSNKAYWMSQTVGVIKVITVLSLTGARNGAVERIPTQVHNKDAMVYAQAGKVVGVALLSGQVGHEKSCLGETHGEVCLQVTPHAMGGR